MSKIINNLNQSLEQQFNLNELQDITDNNLQTEAKTVVGAINEIIGKQVISNAIGTPLIASDTWNDMETKINDLLNTFKTNMMNNDVIVESSDKFKSLIDKIATLADKVPEVNPNAETAICMYCSQGDFTTYKTGEGGLIKTIRCNNPEITTVEIIFSLFVEHIATAGGGYCKMVLEHKRGDTIINTITKTCESVNSSIVGLYTFHCKFDNVQFGDVITLTHVVTYNTPAYLSGYGDGILVFYRADI